MSRTLERSMARREYEKFARRWREEKRLAGIYGKAGYRRPSFAEWYHIHQRDLEMMRQSTPADVVEYLQEDPWAPNPGGKDDLRAASPEPSEEEGERGVLTLDIATGEEERNG